MQLNPRYLMWMWIGIIIISVPVQQKPKLTQLYKLYEF